MKVDRKPEKWPPRLKPPSPTYELRKVQGRRYCTEVQAGASVGRQGEAGGLELRVRGMNAKPLHDWRRYHPMAHAIASEITPPLLALRTRTLVRDITTSRKVSKATAMRAVAIARGAR